MKYWKLASTITILVLSTSANSSVINTLNGVNYEWMELTETAGLSRDQVELRLADSNDVLFGYEYASRALVEDLFTSYATYDGMDGIHGAANVVSGVQRYFEDFGSASASNVYATSSLAVVDSSYRYTPDYRFNTFVLFGVSGECDETRSCYGRQLLYFNNDIPVSANMDGRGGYDASTSPYLRDYDIVHADNASQLVRISSVPIPAAIWLFGSGLIGLVGLARRKKA